VQARKLSLARSGPGSLLRLGGRVIVKVRFESGAGKRLEALRGAGAKILAASGKYQTATVAALPASLAALGDVSGVRSIDEELAPLVSGVAPPELTSTTFACPFGAATSEGDLQLNAMKARTEFNADGTGVTVGILSDSYNADSTAPTSAAEDVVSGDLPGSGNPCGHVAPVAVLSDYSPGPNEPEATDEGRAMAQIVHDLAPGAKLAFATAFEGEEPFATNIEKLAAPIGSGGAGADVIVDDISYFNEPFFQEGPVGVAIHNVTEKGVAYFSAAGNNNPQLPNHNVASWEATNFRDSGACPPKLQALPGFGAGHCMDFNPSLSEFDDTFGITVESGANLLVDLQWKEPWLGVESDLDAFLLDATGAPMEEAGELVGSTTDNLTSQKPVEVFSWENPGPTQEVQLAVNRCTSSCNPAASLTAMPRLKFALLENGAGVSSTEYSASNEGDVVGPTIFGHSGGADTMSVGAIRFNTKSAPESFSSRGPVTHYFGPVKGAVPAAPIEPETLHKPDLVATDGGADTFFGSCASDHAWRFFGTSAAAPHAAAVAALELSLKPAATVQEIKQAEIEQARPIAGFGTDSGGAGLLDASAALGQLFGSNPGTGTAFGPGFPPPDCTLAPEKTPVTPPVPATPVPPSPAAGHNPPSTSFARRPHRHVKTDDSSAFVSFRFRSDQAGTFLCSIDGRPFRPCRRKLARRFSLGVHTVRVAARNSAGETDPTPAAFRFVVGRSG
jgi:hypothetical protein